MIKKKETGITTVRNNMPARYKKLYQSAMSGKSKATAIKAFCCECMGYSMLEVYKCSDTGCPLFNHRPKKQEKEKNE